MNSLLVLIFMQIIACLGTEAKDERFKIYCFDRHVAVGNLAMYEYDRSWATFLKNADVTKASLVISDREIETYNWVKQEVKLTDAGCEELKKFAKTNHYLGHLKFIATLDGKRLYAGEFLSFMSAMAIRHPVIHYDIERISTEKSIRIYPIHSIAPISEAPAELRERTATKDVEDFFRTIGKLR